MKGDWPERHTEFPQITVVVSGTMPGISKTNGEAVALTESMEEGFQVTEQGGEIVHKDAVGVLSRRMISLEHRMERIERQIGSLKSKLNGRVARIEDKLKALSKVQQEILKKMDEWDRLHPITAPCTGLSTEKSSSIHVVGGIVDRLPLEQKRKRMWTAKKSRSSTQIRKGKYQRHVKPSSYCQSSLVKNYKKMRAKLAASAVPPLATIVGSSATAIPLATTRHELNLDDIGSSSASTSAGFATEEQQLE